MMVSGMGSRQLLMKLLTEREWSCQGWKQAAVDAGIADRKGMVVSGVGSKQLLMQL